MAKSAILSVRIVGDAKSAVMSMKQTSAAVAGLQRAASSARSMTGSIFSSVSKLSLMASVFGSLSAVALSSVGSILSLGGALASILPVGLMLPGLLAGVGVAGGVLIAALKDAGDYLGDLAPRFSELQDSISGAFWDRAAAPIRDMIESVLPELEGGITEVAHQLGGWAVAISGAISSASGITAIKGIISATAKAIDLAGDGVGVFTEALLKLTNVGARFLPIMALKFNEVADSFLQWVTMAEESGQVFNWITNGLTGLSLLGASIMSIIGIFGGLTRAATEAGGIGLAGFAAGLEAINKVVNGPTFQNALITVFTGANEAVKQLGPGITALGGAFAALAPTLAQIMPLATSGLSAIVEGVAELLAHPAVAGGLVSAFDGINTGLTALGGSFESLAPLISGALILFGGLAEGVLPLLADVITTIAPPIGEVVTSIGEWVAANPQLTAAIIAITGALGILVPIITSVATFVGTMVTAWAAVTAALGPVATAFGGIVTIFDLLGISLAAVLVPVGLIAGGIALLAGAFTYALTTSEPFRQALVDLWNGLTSLAQPIIDAVLPALQQMGDSFMNLVKTVMEALTPMMTAIVEFAAAVLEALQPVADWIGQTLSPVFQFLAETVDSAFTWIGDIISSAAAFITDIFEALTAAVKGDWEGMWGHLGDALVSGLDLIKSLFLDGLKFVAETVWSATFRIAEMFSNFVAGVIDVVGGFLVKLVSFFTEGMIDLGNAVKQGIENVKAFFSELPEKVRSALSGWGEKMRAIGDDAVQGMVNGIKGAAGRVMSAVQDMVSAIPAKARSLLGIASPSKVFKSIGQYTAQGLSIGIDSMAPRAIGSVHDLAKKLITAGSGIELAPPGLSLATTPTVAPSASYGTKTSAPSTGQVTNNYVINLNGFTDPLQAAREIRKVLEYHDTMVGYGTV